MFPRLHSGRLDHPPLQLDLAAFRLLPEAEFDALPFNAKLEYLKSAIEARRIINTQISETLFGLKYDKPDSN